MTEHKILKYENGKYSVDIDISTSEWKSMLLNKKLFTPSSMDMIWKWYLEESHQAISKDPKPFRQPILGRRFFSVRKKFLLVPSI